MYCPKEGMGQWLLQITIVSVISAGPTMSPHRAAASQPLMYFRLLYYPQEYCLSQEGAGDTVSHAK